MRKTAISFDHVAAIGATLPDVEVSTTFGAPALKVRGKMFVCVPSHRSAETGSIVVRMAIADRDAMLAEDPVTYYLPDHYVGYPCVLVRLNHVRPDALRELVVMAHRFVTTKVLRPGATKTGPRRGHKRTSR